MDRERFNQIAKELNKTAREAESHGICVEKRNFFTRFEDAGDVFNVAMTGLIGANFNYLPSYDKVIDWLKDNGAKSLILIGKCGTGKSVIATKVIPLMFASKGFYFVPQNAKEFAKNGQISGKSFWIVDDLGTEGIVKEYGTEVDKVSELLDWIDLRGGCAVITTNLTQEQLKERYGERNYDRLKANFKIVAFDHESMRGL